MRQFSACFSICTAVPARAGASWALGPEGGIGDQGGKRGGLALLRPWHWLNLGDCYLSGHWEAGISYWRAGREGRFGNDEIVDFSFTPTFRYQRDPRGGWIAPYAEAGVGLHLLTNTSFGNDDYSIPFGFGSYAGIGVRFGQGGRFELGARLQHISNADLGDRNPGANFQFLRFAYYF